MATPDSTRKYPLQRPPHHKPPVPRWQLVFPPDVTQVHTIYIGVQSHCQPGEATSKSRQEAEALLGEWASNRTDDGLLASERFTCINGGDCSGSVAWVCYFSSEASYHRLLDRLDLEALHNSLDPETRADTGLWYEAFTTKVVRLETNYTGTDYLPGLARIPGTSTEEHTLTAYWGAARDRIPESATERFGEVDGPLKVDTERQTEAAFQDVCGTNDKNVVHIRSGQFWETCDSDEAEAYEKRLEPALEKGLQYLWSNPVETGAMGLRYLRNQPTEDSQQTSPKRKETCVAGFFKSLASLEAWAQTHKSHLAIYHGAMSHAKKYGRERKFRTWHEVSVLEKDAARFRYYNCTLGTGLASFLLRNEGDTSEAIG